MEVLRKDEEEWWFAKHEDGRQGSIPVPYVQIVSLFIHIISQLLNIADSSCTWIIVICSCDCILVLLCVIYLHLLPPPPKKNVQIEDNSQPFLAKATMDRECPYDPTALPFKVYTYTCEINLCGHISDGTQFNFQTTNFFLLSINCVYARHFKCRNVMLGHK